MTAREVFNAVKKFKDWESRAKVLIEPHCGGGKTQLNNFNAMMTSIKRRMREVKIK